MRIRCPPARWPVSWAKHADDLVRRLGIEQRAGVDEDVAAVHHEGVEAAVVDDDDLDVVLGEAGDAQDRPRIVAQQVLDLGVADDRQLGRALRVHRRHAAGPKAGDRDGGGGQQRQGAGRWRAAPGPDRSRVLDHAALIDQMGVNLVTRHYAVNAGRDHVTGCAAITPWTPSKRVNAATAGRLSAPGEGAFDHAGSGKTRC